MAASAPVCPAFISGTCLAMTQGADPCNEDVCAESIDTHTTDELPPFTGDRPRCVQCGHCGAATEYRPHGHCMHPTEAIVGFEPNPRLHRACNLCGYAWDEATVNRPDNTTGA